MLGMYYIYIPISIKMLANQNHPPKTLVGHVDYQFYRYNTVELASLIIYPVPSGNLA